jgi:hypothetical protein
MRHPLAEVMTPEEITRRYAAAAAATDTGPHANWFHFATWGTHAIARIIRTTRGTITSEALTRAEQRIYDSVVVERPPAVREGFNWYRLAREDPTNAKRFVCLGTQAIARYEQRLIDEDIGRAFDAMPFSPELLTSMLTVEFPGETLHIGHDVSGFPGTAVTDWRVYEQRMGWILPVIVTRQEDPTLYRANYHAVLAAAHDQIDDLRKARL